MMRYLLFWLARKLKRVAIHAPNRFCPIDCRFVMHHNEGRDGGYRCGKFGGGLNGWGHWADAEDNDWAWRKVPKCRGKVAAKAEEVEK